MTNIEHALSIVAGNVNRRDLAATLRQVSPAIRSSNEANVRILEDKRVVIWRRISREHVHIFQVFDLSPDISKWMDELKVIKADAKTIIRRGDIVENVEGGAYILNVCIYNGAKFISIWDSDNEKVKPIPPEFELIKEFRNPGYFNINYRNYKDDFVNEEYSEDLPNNEGVYNQVICCILKDKLKLEHVHQNDLNTIFWNISTIKEFTNKTVHNGLVYFLNVTSDNVCSRNVLLADVLPEAVNNETFFGKKNKLKQVKSDIVYLKQL